MIALVVMATMVCIAYPYYEHFLLKSRRLDALATLAQDQLMLERCYAQNFSYNTCLLLFTFPHPSTQGFYTITITDLEAETYTLIATPKGSQIKDTNCARMSLDQSNLKIALDGSGNIQTTCWNRL